MVAASGADAQAQVVLDSTFSNAAHAGRLVDDALQAGKAVTVLYVNRPLGEALMGMIERAGSKGRVATVDQLIGSQRGAAETVRKLWGKYSADPRVAFHFLDNGADKTSEGGIETAVPRNYTKNRRLLNELLDREYEAKRAGRERVVQARGIVHGPAGGISRSERARLQAENPPHKIAGDKIASATNSYN